MLTDKQIWDVWESAFDKPVFLDHKPTAEEILLIRIKAVIVEAVKAEQERRY
mgnify:CR=1 FL=1